MTAEEGNIKYRSLIQQKRDLLKKAGGLDTFIKKRQLRRREEGGAKFPDIALSGCEIANPFDTKGK